MNILVAGGAGFLGSHLCERLLENGDDVWCVDDLSTGDARNVEHLQSNANFHYQELNVAEAVLSLEDLVVPKLERVYHLASPASPVAYGQMPIHTLMAGSRGTQNLLDLAHDEGARLLLASTSEVYGDPQIHPQPETYWGNVNPIGWRSCYDEAKRFAEALTVAYQREGLVEEARIARIFNSYGPKMRLDDGRPMNTFILAALKGEPIPVQGDGNQTRSFCYVEDTVEGLIRLMESPYWGPINIGKASPISIKELAKTILKLTGSTSSIESTSRVADDPQDRMPDTRLATSLLGWTATTNLEDGLEKTIAWVKEQLVAGEVVGAS